MRKLLLVIGYWLLVIGLAGCVVRTYPVTKDRLDQDLSSGNLGYLKGEAKAAERQKPRKTERTTQVVEIELYSPIKFKKLPKQREIKKSSMQKLEDTEAWGNRGYITQSLTPEIAEPETTLRSTLTFKKYTVQKNDTLQKISKEFYGTSKKWTKIYEINKNILKSPNKIYPGQVIDIPVEELKEPQENLK